MVTALGMDLSHSCINALSGINRIMELDSKIVDIKTSQPVPIKAHAIPFLQGYEHIGKLLHLAAFALKNLQDSDCNSTRRGFIMVIPNPLKYSTSKTIKEYINYAFDDHLHRYNIDLLSKRLRYIIHDNFEKSNIIIIESGSNGFISALEKGNELINTQQWDSFVVCVVDSLCENYALQWLVDNKKITPEGEKDGIIPGEAGVVMVVRKKNRVLPKQKHQYKLKYMYEYLINPSDREKTGSITLADLIDKSIHPDFINSTDLLFIHDMNGEEWRRNNWIDTQIKLLAKNPDWKLVPTVYPAEFWGDTGIGAFPLGVGLGVYLLSQPGNRYKQILVVQNSDEGMCGIIALEKEE